jgi:hypothetical protein
MSIASVASAAEAIDFEASTLVEIPTHTFVIASEAGEGNQALTSERIQYNPVVAPNVGVGVKFGSLSLEGRRKMNEANQGDRDTYGTTTYTDVSAEWRVRYLRVAGFRQIYQGFYTDLTGQSGVSSSFETSDSEDTPDSSDATRQSADAIRDEPGIQKRPDLAVTYEGASLTGAIPFLDLMGPSTDGKGFPPGSIFEFVIQATYSRLEVGDDDPLIPHSRSDTMASAADITKLTADGVGYGGGLDLDIPVTPGFRFLMRGVAGGGTQRQRLTESGTIGEPRNAPFKYLSGNIGGDWHGERHSVVANFYVDTMSSDLRDFKLTSNRLGMLARYVYAFKDAK